LSNIRFVAYDAALMEHMFAPGEVDKIWITFPDPYPKKRHIRRRLTAPSFLQVYRKVLAPGGELHLKTDNPDFFDYTLEMLKLEGANVIARTNDLHASELLNHENGFMTSYEATFVAQGLTIRYLACRF
jgi:tRNA (guanine-N7-)-methyltransferase